MDNIDNNILIDKQIRNNLPYTWSPFFSRFGKLTNIQRFTIPLILNGSNVVISSPKATGKTEAVLAPVLERQIKNPSDTLSIIYISPTRALVNDIYTRMKPAFDYLGVRLSRRTGDNPEFKRDRITPFLITTPESLDSLISRYPPLFKTVEAIIIDEVHLLHNSYRGDQLCILLRRLKRITYTQPNMYVMSATICDPQSIGKKFIEGDFRVAIKKTSLSIDYYLVKGSNFIQKLEKEVRLRNLKKLLFFSNSRFEAEKTAKILSTLSFGRNIWVHHGSMSRREREDTEKLFNKTKTGVCVATSTLEYGIDIGNIDAVVLITPPPDAASLLQRLGRGNRRKENYILAYGIYLDEIQKIIFEQLFKDAQNEKHISLYHPFDMSIICQQIFSYLHQKVRVGTSEDTLKRLFKGIVDSDDIVKILRVLIDKKLIKIGKSELLYPGEKIGNAIVYGSIHSNIPDRKEFEVYNIATGKMIGRVENPFPTFTLGGRDWVVASCESKRVWVKHVGRGNEAKNVFLGRRHGFWDFKFGSRMKKKIFPNISDNEIPYMISDSYFHIYHFAGPIYSFIWIYALKEKINIEDVGDIIFVSESMDIIPSYNDIENAVKNTYSVLTNFMNIGRYYGLLPQELREKQVLSFLRIDEFSDWLSNIKLVNAKDISFNPLPN